AGRRQVRDRQRGRGGGQDLVGARVRGQLGEQRALVIGILDHRLDQEGRLCQLVQIADDAYPIRAAVERGQLVAVLGYGAPYAIRRCGGAGPQQDFSVGGGDGGKACRDGAGAGDGESFLQGISWS